MQARARAEQMKSDSEKAMKMMGVNERVDWQILRNRKRIQMEWNSEGTKECFEREANHIDDMSVCLDNVSAFSL